MAFTIRKLKLRPWPVTVKQLVSSADGVVAEVENEFVLEFRPFSEAEFKALVDRVTGAAEKAVKAEEETKVEGDAKTEVDAKADRPVAELLANNAEIFAGLVGGWSKVLDDAGVPVPFSADALRALVTGPDGMAVSTGINKALAELRFGLAPAKNSPTSAVPGPVPGPAEVATNSPATLPPSA